MNIEAATMAGALASAGANDDFPLHANNQEVQK
jgi:hypothetical protein